MRGQSNKHLLLVLYLTYQEPASKLPQGRLQIGYRLLEIDSKLVRSFMAGGIET
jgi:hypothetical protein